MRFQVVSLRYKIIVTLQFDLLSPCITSCFSKGIPPRLTFVSTRSLGQLVCLELPGSQWQVYCRSRGMPMCNNRQAVVIAGLLELHFYCLPLCCYQCWRVAWTADRRSCSSGAVLLVFLYK